MSNSTVAAQKICCLAVFVVLRKIQPDESQVCFLLSCLEMFEWNHTWAFNDIGTGSLAVLLSQRWLHINKPTSKFHRNSTCLREKWHYLTEWETQQHIKVDTLTSSTHNTHIYNPIQINQSNYSLMFLHEHAYIQLVRCWHTFRKCLQYGNMIQTLQPTYILNIKWTNPF